MRFYQSQDENGLSRNPHLKITKADHYVLAYDARLSPNLKLKLEGYWQKLYDVPVIDGSSYSLLNYQWDDYFEDPLVNQGSGRNTGIDLTLERYLKDGYYYMITASVFDSKYKGGDGIERNTSFNRNYVFNLLSGKEWQLTSNNVWGLNGKVAFMGG